MQAAGLVRLRGRRLELTPSGRDALVARPEAVLKRLWESWAEATLFDELRRIDEVKGQEGRARRHFTPLADRRGSIATVLAACPVGRWVELKAFMRHMRVMRQEFSVSDNPWLLYVTDAHYGSMGYDGCDPVLTEAYVRCVLLEYLATLGMIDVASVSPEAAPTPYWTSIPWGVDELERFSRYDGLLYLRLTALGAHALGLAERYEAPAVAAGSELRVLPNLDLVATNGLAAADRITLDLYAAQASEYVWRLERDRLLQAAEEGRSLAELRTFLETASDGALPDTVERFLEGTERRASSLVDAGEARLFECADAALALQVVSDTRARGACMLAGERHLVVPASAEKRFRGALRRLGYGVSPAGRVGGA